MDIVSEQKRAQARAVAQGKAQGKVQEKVQEKAKAVQQAPKKAEKKAPVAWTREQAATNAWRRDDDRACSLPFTGSVLWNVLLWSAIFDLLIEAGRAARAALREKRRRAKVLKPAPRPLHASPEPAVVSAQWRKAKDSLEETLRFGALLLDLEPFVDSSPIVGYNRAGTRKRIVARRPGIKGWLRTHCPEIPYSTAMRYKQLAARARKVCGLSREVPLGWAFASEAEHDEGRPPRVRTVLPAAREALGGLVAGHRSRRGLSRTLDESFGVACRPLSRPRRKPDPAARRRISERWVARVSERVRWRLERMPEGLTVDLRERLARELLSCADQVRRNPA